MKQCTLGLIILFFTSCINKQALKEIEYKGIITKIYQEPMQHNMYFFDIHTMYGEAGVTASLWPYSWEYAIVGDSIIKPPDTLMIIIKKPDGSSKEFFYSQSLSTLRPSGCEIKILREKQAKNKMQNFSP